jgi:hypothetical protein
MSDTRRFVVVSSSQGSIGRRYQVPFDKNYPIDAARKAAVLAAKSCWRILDGLPCIRMTVREAGGEAGPPYTFDVERVLLSTPMVVRLEGREFRVEHTIVARRAFE